MDWSFHRTNLKWYELIWAGLPVAIATLGGAIGGACGVVAFGINVNLMKRPWGKFWKYGSTATVSLAALGIYLILARVTVSFIYGSPDEQVTRELRQSQLYVAIEKSNPADAARMKAGVLEAVKQGKSDSEVRILVQSYILTLAKKYVPVASDQAITDFAGVATLEIDQIGAKDVDACFQYLYPKPGVPPIDLRRYVSPEVIQRDAMSTEEVVRSAIENPQRVPDRPEVADALNEVVRQLVAAYGASDVRALSSPDKLDHARACSMVGALYKDALSLPAAARVPLLRFLFAQSSSA